LQQKDLRACWMAKPGFLVGHPPEFWRTVPCTGRCRAVPGLGVSRGSLADASADGPFISSRSFSHRAMTQLPRANLSRLGRVCKHQSLWRPSVNQRQHRTRKQTSKPQGQPHPRTLVRLGGRECPSASLRTKRHPNVKGKNRIQGCATRHSSSSGVPPAQIANSGKRVCGVSGV